MCVHLDPEILCVIYFCRKIYIYVEICKYYAEKGRIICNIRKVRNKLSDCQKWKCLIELCYI